MPQLLFPARSAQATRTSVPPVGEAARVIDRVCDRWRASSHYFLRSVRCDFNEGVLTVSGRVPTFYLKQVAQSLAQGVDGVDRVVNLLDVVNAGGVQ